MERSNNNCFIFIFILNSYSSCVAALVVQFMDAAVRVEAFNLHYLTFVWKAVHIVCLSQQIFCTFRKRSLDIRIKWDCFELRISIDGLFYAFLNLWLYGIWNGLPHSLKFWSRLIFDPLLFWDTLLLEPLMQFTSFNFGPPFPKIIFSCFVFVKNFLRGVFIFILVHPKW